MQVNYRLRLTSGQIEDENTSFIDPETVRVFNEDFVNDVLDYTSATGEPIRLVGERQVQRKSQLDSLTHEVNDSQKVLESKIKLEKNMPNPNDHLSKAARKTKHDLNILNYNINSVRYYLDNYTEEELKNSSLSQEELNSNYDVWKRSQHFSKIRLDERNLFQEAVDNMHSVIELLDRDVFYTVIEELDKDLHLRNWVSDGLSLHKDRSTCSFCGNKITEERLSKLRSYFSESLNNLLREIGQNLEFVESIWHQFDDYARIEVDGLHPELRENVRSEKENLEYYREKVSHCLNEIEKALIRKRETPGEKVYLENYSELISDLSEVAKRIEHVNYVLSQNNSRIDSIQEEIKSARVKIEMHNISEVMEEYLRDREQAQQAKKEIQDLKNHISDKSQEIENLKSEIYDHGFGANRLNERLRSFSGRDDITIRTKDFGYQIEREGRVAYNLSEGEKTIIAFAYFLVKLYENNYQVQDRIVVIDDPVSSLDDHFLYAAAVFLRTYVESANQLFILTHNSLFFNEILGWMINISFKNISLPDGLGKKFVGCVDINKNEKGYRYSTVVKLDYKTSKRFESEYLVNLQILVRSFFKGNGIRSLEDAIISANIARKVIEGFIKFKWPNKSGAELRLHNIEPEINPGLEPEKFYVLSRLIDKGSHGFAGDVTQTDEHKISEISKAVAYTLEFLKSADQEHFRSAMKAIDWEHKVDDV